MTMFLRNKQNDTVVEIEINKLKDSSINLSSVVVIESFSKLLLDNLHRKEETISDFELLSELRGWFFEEYLIDIGIGNYKKCKSDVKEILMGIGEKYSLYYVED